VWWIIGIGCFVGGALMLIYEFTAGPLQPYDYDKDYDYDRWSQASEDDDQSCNGSHA
jgi:hypothetical protein